MNICSAKLLLFASNIIIISKIHIYKNCHTSLQCQKTWALTLCRLKVKGVSYGLSWPPCFLNHSTVLVGTCCMECVSTKCPFLVPWVISDLRVSGQGVWLGTRGPRRLRPIVGWNWVRGWNGVVWGWGQWGQPLSILYLLKTKLQEIDLETAKCNFFLDRKWLAWKLENC